MKRILRLGLFLNIIAIYIVGNNQIASADTVANMESQASIHFDKTYFPPEVDPLIPSGSTSFPVYTGKSVLPKTGETGSQLGQMFGLLLLISTSLMFIRINKTKKEN